MPKAFTDNVLGHRSKFEVLTQTMPHAEASATYVGGGDPVEIGYFELQLVRSLASLDGADVVDVGCGIGRLTRHLRHEPINSYLGTDIIPEILEQAVATAGGDARFRFEIARDCTIPLGDASASLVTGFSVLTHLIDEEVFDYFRETRRVLRPGGTALFTFFDFHNPQHEEMFITHASHHRGGQGDMLKFTTPDVLQLFVRRCGFASARFIDGQEPIAVSGLPSPLLDVSRLPSTFQMGQSTCLLRA